MIRLAVLSAICALSAGPVLAADGEQLFNMQCRMCHVGSPMGPSLSGVAGGKVAGGSYAYSPALKAKGGTWTDAALDAYLKAPVAFAPGTKMMLQVPSGQDRAALIAYLKTLK